MKTVRAYQTREMGEVDRYSWEDGNVVHYAYLPQKEITYEYNAQLASGEFPFPGCQFTPAGRFRRGFACQPAVWENEPEPADPCLLV